MLGQHLAEAAGAGPAERATTWWTSALRFLGCTGHGFEVAVVFGDEAEALRLLALGLTTRQVAHRLVISAKTAEHHVQHVYTKIGVSTQGAAALFAIERGLVVADV